MRVLIVDDELDIRMLVRMQLGFVSGVGAIDEAADGMQAIEAASRHQPDVIVLDINMPVMSGDQALPRLRIVAPSATIIVHSAAPANALGDVLDQADGYVQKGWDDVEDVVADLVRAKTDKQFAFS